MVNAVNLLKKAIKRDAEVASHPSRVTASNAADAARGAREFDLSSRELRYRFKNFIVPDFIGPATQPVKNPKLIVVVAPTGAGKSHMIDKIVRDFADKGGIVRVQVDDLEPYHPDYKILHLENDLTAHDLVRPTAKKLRDMLVKHLISNKYNVVLETSATNASSTIARVLRFHATGSEVEIHGVAVNSWESRVSLMERFVYSRLSKGYGRNVPLEDHDISCEGSIELVRRFENMVPIKVKTIKIMDRNELLYENDPVSDKQWREPPQGAETMERKIYGELSDEERAQLRYRMEDVGAVAEMMMEINPTDHMLWRPVAQNIYDLHKKFEPPA